MRLTGSESAVTCTAPVEIAGNPAPPGAEYGWLERPGGVRLRYGLWKKPPDQPNTARGTVVVIPGRTEFIEKYFEVVGELLSRGYGVAVLDIRGQGLSTRLLSNRTKGHVACFLDYSHDLNSWINEVVTARLPAPYRLLTHSMGGAIALAYLHDNPGVIERAAMIAPMVKLKAVPIPYPLAAFFVKMAKSVFGPEAATASGPRSDPTLMPFERNVVTHDAGRFDREQALLAACPDLVVGAPTLGWMSQAVAIAAKLADPAYVQAIKIPILVFCAEEDRLINNQAEVELAARLPAGKLVTIAGAHHEILMETDARREAFWRAFDAFMAEEKAGAGA